jgi:hypothetical protein
LRRKGNAGVDALSMRRGRVVPGHGGGEPEEGPPRACPWPGPFTVSDRDLRGRAAFARTALPLRPTIPRKNRPLCVPRSSSSTRHHDSRCRMRRLERRPAREGAWGTPPTRSHGNDLGPPSGATLERAPGHGLATAGRRPQVRGARGRRGSASDAGDEPDAAREGDRPAHQADAAGLEPGLFSEKEDEGKDQGEDR